MSKPKRRIPEPPHRTKHLTITLTPEESIRIGRVAKKQGHTKSSFGRITILEAVEKAMTALAASR